MEDVKSALSAGAAIVTLEDSVKSPMEEDREACMGISTSDVRVNSPIDIESDACTGISTSDARVNSPIEAVSVALRELVPSSGRLGISGSSDPLRAPMLQKSVSEFLAIRPLITFSLFGPIY